MVDHDMKGGDKVIIIRIRVIIIRMSYAISKDNIVAIITCFWKMRKKTPDVIA